MKLYNLLIIILSGTLIMSCGDDDAPPPETIKIQRENDFVWEAMNSWYLWQTEKGEKLADTKDDDYNSYAEFLNSYSTPEALFEDLRYQPDVVDRFSFMTDDYVALQNSFQGIEESFGFNFQAALYGTDNVFALVRYVLPGSPAEAAGLERGDIIIKVNGTLINRDNYYNLLYEQTQANFGLGTFNSSSNSISDSGESLSMTATVIDENPVYLAETITLSNGVKVGYLSYNQFISSYNDEMNAAFADFKAAGVTEMVLDLRYNPGGSILTALYLGSMLYDTDGSKTFAAIEYNSKHSQYNGDYTFDNTLQIYNSNYEVVGTEPINSLGLSRIYILTSSRTASASELIINGLKPYIDVFLIGDTTTGKNVGSVTLYDSPSSDYLDQSTANTAHKYALQPLVSRLQNKQGFSDYTNGFDPDIEINEWDYLGNFQPLGDVNEPMLATALQQICPSCRSIAPIQKTNSIGDGFEPIGETGQDKFGFKEMYLNELLLK